MYIGGQYTKLQDIGGHEGHCRYHDISMTSTRYLLKVMMKEIAYSLHNPPPPHTHTHHDCTTRSRHFVFLKIILANNPGVYINNRTKEPIVISHNILPYFFIDSFFIKNVFVRYKRF